jgi:hypothetical protein
LAEKIGDEGRVVGGYGLDMVDKSPEKASDRDEPLKLPMDPEEALRALLEVDPDSPTANADGKRKAARAGKRE